MDVDGVNAFVINSTDGIVVRKVRNSAKIT